MRLLFILGIFLAASGLAGACAASSWQTMAFDGNVFAKGSGSGAIMVRDGYLPVSAGAAMPREDKLPEGTGAVAVFCYQQRSGGKLRPQGGSAPMAGAVITVSATSLKLAGRTDASGYLILALPPGSYDLGLFGLSKKVTVEGGKTALVAMRGGKRMVD